jgi:hypothetical protein
MQFVTSENYLKLEKIITSKKVILAGIIISILFIFTQPFFAFILITIYFSLRRLIARKNFMIKYAKDNNLKFEIYSEQEFPGRLFKLGNKSKSKVLNLIHGEYKDHPIKIFHHSYSTGSGKNRRTYNFTVCELEIKNTFFPFILLKSDSMMRYASHDFIGYDKDTKISLEKEFDKKFDLYCQSDYEIEVLQIFDKELLSYLVEHGNKFSIEFAEEKIYIYDDKVIMKNEEMDEIYNILKKIVDKSGPLLKRLHDDFSSMKESYSK